MIYTHSMLGEENSYISEYSLPPGDFLALPEPDLITGVGHGHYRPVNREKPKANAYKRKHKKIKMAKNSRRRNR